MRRKIKRSGVKKTARRTTNTQEKSIIKRINGTNKLFSDRENGGARKDRRGNKEFDGLCHSKESRKVFSPSPAVIFMSTSQNKRGRIKRRTRVQQASTFRTVEFMRAERD